MKEDEARRRVKRMIAQGIYHQHDLFGVLYPEWNGHYSKLRDIISEEKENA